MCGVAERILPTALPLVSARSDPAREPIKAEREDSPEPKRMLRMVLVTVTVSGWTGLVSPRQFSRSHGSTGAVAKFWRLPRVEHAGGICTSEPEVAHDPERPCREAEAPVEGRFQGSPFRGDADPPGR